MLTHGTLSFPFLFLFHTYIYIYNLFVFHGEKFRNISRVLTGFSEEKKNKQAIENKDISVFT